MLVLESEPHPAVPEACSRASISCKIMRLHIDTHSRWYVAPSSSRTTRHRGPDATLWDAGHVRSLQGPPRQTPPTTAAQCPAIYPRSNGLSSSVTAPSIGPAAHLSLLILVVKWEQAAHGHAKLCLRAILPRCARVRTCNLMRSFVEGLVAGDVIIMG
jgi:hypothetical protein